MAVKDGEAPKLHHVTSETTAEAFATAAAGPRMEKHHGKNHLPAGKHHPSSPKLPNVPSEILEKQYSFRQVFIVFDQLLYHCLYNET